LSASPGRGSTPGKGPATAKVRKRRRPAGPSVRAKAASILGLPVGWLVAFLILPLVMVAVVGFATLDRNYLLTFSPYTFENYLTVLNLQGGPILLLGRSLVLSVAATLWSLVVGYAIAYYIARLAAEKWRGTLMALVVIPFWVTFIVRIYGLTLFVRPDGIIDSGFQTVGLAGIGDWFVQNFGLGTDAILVFTLVYVWLPFMVLPLFTSLSKLDPQLLEAASDLGASRLRAFWNVTLPLSLPGIITGSIFVFITTLGSFVEPDFLGASPMIGNYVYTQFSLLGGIPLGAAASMFIIISTMLFVSVYARYAEIEASGVSAARKEKSPMGRTTRLLLFVAAAAILAPISVLALLRSVQPRSLLEVFDVVAAAVAVLAMAAHGLYEAEERLGRPPMRARYVRTDAIAFLLVSIAAWILVRTLSYASEVSSRLSMEGGALVVLGLLAATFAGHAGLRLPPRRQGLGDQALRNVRRFLLTGPHLFGYLVVRSGRLLRRAMVLVKAAFAWFADHFGRRALPVFDALAERHGRKILALITLFSMLVFFVPLLLMAAFSFTAGFNPAAFEGFSLRWYVGGGAVERDALFKDAAVLTALGNSVILGITSAFLSLFLGLLAAFAIDRYAFRGKPVLNNAMYLGLVIPSIVLGISLSILVRLANDVVLSPAFGTRWDFGLLSLVVGHTTFNIPLATLVLLISFREFDRSLEEAAMNLGAGPLTTFFRVTLPNIKAGIVSTLLLTFTFSFDEYPVSVFLAGSDPTYPIVAYGILSRKIPTPEANAAATLILVISVVFVLLATKVQKGGAIFRI